MKLTNKSISRSVRKNLREMAMDLPPGSNPDPGIQDKLAQGDTPFDKVEFPDTNEEQPENNFQELLASERYRDVIANVAEYTGQEVSLQGQGGLLPLMRLTMGALQNIIQTEANHREALEELAIELVKKEMAIPEGAFQYDAKIVGMGEMDMEGMNREGDQQGEEGEENDEQAVENEVEIAQNLEHLNFEKAKRRLINSIIQGSAMKGYYMYHYVADRLQDITGSDTLIRDYGLMMSVNDSLYWQFPDESIGAAMGGESMAGKEEVDRNTEPPTIIARGINFPVLVHELIKGVMEMFAVQGQPETGWEEISRSEDTLEKEVWDIRLGPSIWNRIRGQFPEEILLDENQKELQNYLLVAIFKLEAREFLVFVKEVLEGTERGQSMMQQLMEGVRAAFNQEDYTPEVDQIQNEVREAAEETSDQDMETFLQNLGITQEKDEPEAEPGLDDKKLASMGINALNFELNQAIDAENWELAQKIEQMIARKQGNRG